MSLHQVWDALVKVIANNSDPRITQRCDRQGNTYFHVYDPVSGRSSTFGSAAEIRFWLEQRYYQ